jgi:hypothetical protein
MWPAETSAIVNTTAITLKVRRRGGVEETLILGVPFDLLAPSAEFLHQAVPDSERKQQSDGGS